MSRVQFGPISYVARQGSVTDGLIDMADKAYLSIHEVAKHFDVTPTTVYRLAQRGELPGFKIGNQWRFSHSMLESWVADQVTVERIKAEDGSRHSGTRPPKPSTS